MKTAIHAAACINTGCRPAILSYPLSDRETTVFFHGYESEFAEGQLLASPLMEYYNDRDQKVMQAVEWMKVICVGADGAGNRRRLTVLRGANYSTALPWPQDTVFHALPLTGPLS